MQIYHVGPGETYATIAEALAVIAALGQPLTESQQVEVLDNIALEAVTIPGAIEPTASFPLNILNVDFNRPRLTSVNLGDTPFVRFSGFDIAGNVQAGLGDGQMVSENIIRGSLLLVGDGATSITLRAYNNSVHGFTSRGILVKDLRGTIRVMFNSILCLDATGTPWYGLEIDESDVLAKFNIIEAKGGSALSRIISLTNTTSCSVTINRNLYWLDDASSFGAVDLGTPASVATFTAWKEASSQDGDSTFEDPLFGCTDSPGVNLEIAQQSPAIAAGDFDADVDLDIDKTRRPKLVGDPTHSTTLGAFEQAQVITPAGKELILDLIGGLKTLGITKVAVGDKGTISDEEYLQPETPSKVETDLKERIFVMKIQAPPPFTARYVLGSTAFFDCFIGPTPAAGDSLLDAKMDTLSEVGLLADDGTLFMVRTLQRVPFDPLGRTTLRIRFGVAVGEDICDEFAPSLQLTAE